jgi:serine/threonine protein kinase/roadblock/LC7 domain-containing protein
MLTNGQHIGHYQILSPIGAGGMGEVYLAEDSQLDRNVALKILPKEFAADKDRMSRFVREAKSASALNHPNIITIYEIGESDGTHFIATEFIDGKTLTEYAKHNPLNFKSVLEIAVQIASALDDAHSAGIVHRDIKPDNVMVRANGLVKLLDFGIAKLSGSNAQPNLDSEATTAIKSGTTPGMIIGTANYMSPEQAKGQTVDARSDIFSFGVLLYEMIAGHLPFEGATAMEMIAAILKNEPLPLDEAIPKQLRRIVRKSLHKQTDERYQTARDLLLDIKNLKRELEFSEEFERSQVPRSTGSSNVSTARMSENATGALSGVISTRNSLPQTGSSAEYLVSRVNQHKFRAVLILTLAVSLVAGVGFGIYELTGNPKTNITFESAKFSRLTSSGKAVMTAISPDGKWLVYANGDEEQQSLWLQQISNSGSTTQIVPPAAVDFTGLAFSPDGSYVYYTIFEVGASTGTLYQIPVLGGAARKLFNGISGNVRFSPDGKQITYFNHEDDETRLMIANADGTDQRQLLARRGNEFFADLFGSPSPSWSPDGKTIATPVGTHKPKSLSVAAVSPQTGEMTFFSAQKFGAAYNLEWLADGKSLLLIASEGVGSPKIWHIAYPSGEAQMLSNDFYFYKSLSLTADASVVATIQGIIIQNIWIAPTDDTARVSQVTTGSDRSFAPSWTPDGKLVYARGSGGNNDIYIVDSRQGASPKQLTANAGSNHTPAVSPDGRFIVFRSSRTGFMTLWRMDIDGGNLKQLTDNKDFNPSFSPDGREVVYNSFANKSTIWKVGIDGGQPVQLTDKESSYPKFSPDGKQLVSLYQDNPKSPAKIAILASTGGSPVKSFALPSGFDSLANVRWMPDGRSIVYGITKGGVTNLWAQPLEGGEAKQITNFSSDVLYSFDFSRDGKQLTFSRGSIPTDVILISGFKK